MDSEGREVASVDLLFHIVSQRAVPLLWALLTSPSIVVRIHVRLARVGASWALPPILHERPQALISDWAVQVDASAVGVLQSSNEVVLAWVHLNCNRIITNALHWSVQAGA